MRFVQYFSKSQNLNRGINEQRTDPRMVVQTVSLIFVASFPIQCTLHATLPSSERKYYSSVLLMNILNKLHSHGKPSTASNGYTHSIRRKSEVNKLVYQGNDFFAAQLAVFQYPVLVTLRRWGEEREYSPKWVSQNALPFRYCPWGEPLTP